jgi:microcystin-dependent protein
MKSLKINSCSPCSEINTIKCDITRIASVGDIKMSVRKSDFNGWLLCDGRSLDIETYSLLFSIIGYSFGGTGSQFHLPDSRGCVLGTASSVYTVGTTVGEESVQLTVSQMPIHNHGVTNLGHTHDGTTVSSGIHSHGVTNTGHTHTGTTASSGTHTHTSNAVGTTIGLAIADGTNTATSTDSSGGELNVWTTPRALTIDAAGAHTHTFTTDTNTNAGVSIDNAGAHTHTFTTAINTSVGISINNTGGTDPVSLFQPTLFIGNTFIFSGV